MPDIRHWPVVSWTPKGSQTLVDPEGVPDISRWSSAAPTTGCGMPNGFVFDPGGVADCCDPSGVDRLWYRSSFPVVSLRSTTG